MSSPAPAIVWFRDDLRLADNPALDAACQNGRPVVAIYILETGTGRRPLQGAAGWWLSRSLRALGADIAARGGRLLLRAGDPREVILSLTGETGAGLVTWNRRYDAAGVATDQAIKAALKDQGIAAESFSANLLREPWQVRTRSDEPFKVFSPFWRAHQALGDPRPALSAPKRLLDGSQGLASEALDDWGLEPTSPDWAAGFSDWWTPGEAGARERLTTFLDGPLDSYAADRNRPDRDSTSALSPHLRFGEISPVQIWHAAAMTAGTGSARGLDKFLSEIGWREFAYHLLFHWPDLHRTSFQPRFEAFPWHGDPGALRAWQRGLTGYPLVDAGMRQLWQTGWMHNRVRMVVASFLAKHLLIDWREGEAWFWDTLVDADVANNPASWQWVAGSGADAAPYFRIFNPVKQGTTFDPDGTYVRRWVPELGGLPASAIHAPWTASPQVLASAGIRLGETYPRPVVDHDRARQRALEAFGSLAPRAEASP
ncbi:cryptochrome/photolyase family protein [Phreatobacter sp.]|uniref:cryptochrome/photolyase family protein n=1 Tax=Phreatobacter sp. TaxID=1966341 RepID=UPI003F71FB01